jgi:uncharacterized protein (TIGR00255 family)
MTARSSAPTQHEATSPAECRSMTGFAMVRGEHAGWSIRLSVKSVNHRFLDIKLRMPDSLEPYDIRLRQTVKSRIHRGHVDINLDVEPGETALVHINRELLQAYVRAAEELRAQTGSASPLDIVSLLRLPGVIGGISPELPASDEEQEAFGNRLVSLLFEALAKLDDMRRIEGRHLTAELRSRLAHIGDLTEQVRGLVHTLRPAFARRLEARLKELLNGANLDAGRLAQEAAILAERSDISEELDRLRSHLQQFTKLLDGAGELGKKLDFLLQEMHREANTMLSKTPGVESEGLAVTGLALEIKAEIEKLREQVQNIE